MALHYFRVGQDMLGITKKEIIEEIRKERHTKRPWTNEDAKVETNSKMEVDQEETQQANMEDRRALQPGRDTMGPCGLQWDKDEPAICREVMEAIYHVVEIRLMQKSMAQENDEAIDEETAVLIQDLALTELTEEELDAQERPHKARRMIPMILDPQSVAVKECIESIGIKTRTHPAVIKTLIEKFTAHTNARNIKEYWKDPSKDEDNKSSWASVARMMDIEPRASGTTNSKTQDMNGTRKLLIIYEKPDSPFTNDIMSREAQQDRSWEDNNKRTWHHHERVIWNILSYSDIPEYAKIITTSTMVDFFKIAPMITEPIIRIASEAQGERERATFKLLNEGMANHGQQKAQDTITLLKQVCAWFDQPTKILEKFEKSAQTGKLKALCAELLDKMNLQQKLIMTNDSYDTVFTIATAALKWSIMAVDLTNTNEEANKLLWAGHGREIVLWKKAHDKYDWAGLDLETDKDDNKNEPPITGISTGNALIMRNFNWTGPLLPTQTLMIGYMLPQESIFDRHRIAKELYQRERLLDTQKLLKRLKALPQKKQPKELAIPRSATQEDFVRIANEHIEMETKASENAEAHLVVSRTSPVHGGSECRIMKRTQAQGLCRTFKIDHWPSAPAAVKYESVSKEMGLDGILEEQYTIPNRSQQQIIMPLLKHDGINEIHSMITGGKLMIKEKGLFPTGCNAQMYTMAKILPVVHLDIMDRPGIITTTRNANKKKCITGYEDANTPSGQQYTALNMFREFFDMKEPRSCTSLIISEVKEQAYRLDQGKHLADIMDIAQYSELATTIPDLARIEDLVTRKLEIAILDAKLPQAHKEEENKEGPGEQAWQERYKGTSNLERWELHQYEQKLSTVTMDPGIQKAMDKAFAPSNAIFSSFVKVEAWKKERDNFKTQIKEILREEPTDATNDDEPMAPTETYTWEEKTKRIIQDASKRISNSFTVTTVATVCPNQMLQAKQETKEDCPLCSEHWAYIESLEKSATEATHTLWSTTDTGKLDKALTSITDIIPVPTHTTKYGHANSYTPNSGFYEDFRGNNRTTNHQGHMHLTLRIDGSGQRLQLGACIGTHWKYLSTGVIPELQRITLEMEEEAPAKNDSTGQLGWINDQQLCTLAVTATVDHANRFALDEKGEIILQHELILEMTVNGRHIKNRQTWNHKATGLLEAPATQMALLCEYLGTKRVHHIRGADCCGAIVIHKMMIFPALETEQCVSITKNLIMEWEENRGNLRLAQAMPSIIQLQVEAMLSKVCRQKELLTTGGNYIQLQPHGTWEWDRTATVKDNIDSAYKNISLAATTPNITGIIEGKVEKGPIYKVKANYKTQQGQIVMTPGEKLWGTAMQAGKKFWATGKAAITTEGLYMEIFEDESNQKNTALHELAAMRTTRGGHWYTDYDAKAMTDEVLLAIAESGILTHWIKYEGATAVSLIMMANNLKSEIGTIAEGLSPMEIWIND